MKQKFIFISSFLLPGSGHLYLKHKKTALFGLIFSIFSYIFIFNTINTILTKVFVYHTSGEYAGLWTIGQIPYEDDSFFILLIFVFSIIFLVFLILIAYWFARDSRNIYTKIQNGEEIINLKEQMRAVAPDLIPNMITSPIFILMLIFMLIPSIISIMIVFTNYAKPILPPAFLLEWTGFDNFVSLITNPKTSAVFAETFQWTMIWTFCASTFSIALGMFLAVLTNAKKIKGKKFIRTVFLLPWAVPAFLTILIFQIFFSKIGAANTMLIPFLTGTDYSISTAVPFLIDPDLAKMTIIMIQTWLGFPFVYVLVTGILQAIPDDLYEASSIDGGNAWSNFWDITFPMIMMSAAPMLITQYTFNFNNVTIIYLLGSSVVKDVGSYYSPLETISSLGYQLTLQADFATAAVFTLITSVCVSAVVVTMWLKTGAFRNEEVM